MASTGTSDCVYNLISILDHSLKGTQVYDQYVKDAEAEGNQELASFFRDVQEEDRKRSDRAKKLLAHHLTH
jgi:rubrerythrin